MNVIFLQMMWISGSMISFYYINTIKTYLDDTSDGLKFIRLLPLVNASCAFVMLMLFLFFDLNLFVDPVNPHFDFKNVFMQSIGSFNPSIGVKLLSVLTLFTTLVSSVYFLIFIFKSKQSHKALTVGIVLDFIIIFNDLLPTISDATYVVPLMFLANLFEILRITHANQLAASNRINMMRKELIHTSKLSEAGNYYASLAHEILNPLFAAKGYLKLMTDKLGPYLATSDSDIQKYSDLILKQHDRIESLALNVRSYTKTGSSLEDVTDIHSLINDSIETISLKASRQDVVLHYNPINQDIKIKCYRDEIVQIITNLLNNSIDAISNQSEKWISIEISLGANQDVRIFIKDSGPGILPELREKIWEHRFTTKDHGAGLGLSICSEIIKKHGGELSLNNQSSNTEFVIILPIMT